ncbi:MarR family winged helix-turn-helix transcriptional regulator [Clostridium sardiniense]|uniref:MarR family winged helix-turn-helix transcriptional regulator n=1 Tax=Clostridium sardiniense TaxID=29369 RepID=UPI003D35133E
MRKNNTETFQYLFRAISHHLKKIGDEGSDSFGLTGYQARMVSYIAENEHKGLSQSDLEKAFDRKGSSITSMLKVLEKNEFISRRIDPKDERKKQIYTLDKAKVLIENFEDLFKNLEEKITEGMEDTEKKELSRLLNIVLSNLEK